MSHQFVTFPGIKAPHSGILFGYPSVHLRRSWKAAQVLTTVYHTDRTEMHTVEIDQLQVDITRPLCKENIPPAIVEVSYTVFVETGCQSPDSPEHIFLTVEMTMEEHVIAPGTLGLQSD
jgi:hypothetical protein